MLGDEVGDGLGLLAAVDGVALVGVGECAAFDAFGLGDACGLVMTAEFEELEGLAPVRPGGVDEDSAATGVVATRLADPG